MKFQLNTSNSRGRYIKNFKDQGSRSESDRVTSMNENAVHFIRAHVDCINL